MLLLLLCLPLRCAFTVCIRFLFLTDVDTDNVWRISLACRFTSWLLSEITGYSYCHCLLLFYGYCSRSSKCVLVVIVISDVVVDVKKCMQAYKQYGFCRWCVFVFLLLFVVFISHFYGGAYVGCGKKARLLVKSWYTLCNPWKKKQICFKIIFF